MTPNPQPNYAELSNGSSDPIPADDLLADDLAGRGLRAPAEIGVGSFDAIPAAALENDPGLESSHSE